MENIEDIIYKEAVKAYKQGEIPVGCVVVKDGKILAKAHNTRHSTHSCIDHAEILAILKAEKKLKDWRLEGCELYVSLKPCNMCYEVIKQARIKTVYYILDSNFNNNTKYATNVEYKSLKTPEFKKLLSDFFKNKR